MGELSGIARGGDPKSEKESKINRGGSQTPQGDLGKLARGGKTGSENVIPINPNAEHDPKGLGTH